MTLDIVDVYRLYVKLPSENKGFELLLLRKNRRPQTPKVGHLVPLTRSVCGGGANRGVNA